MLLWWAVFWWVLCWEKSPVGFDGGDFSVFQGMMGNLYCLYLSDSGDFSGFRGNPLIWLMEGISHVSGFRVGWWCQGHPATDSPRPFCGTNPLSNKRWLSSKLLRYQTRGGVRWCYPVGVLFHNRTSRRLWHSRVAGPVVYARWLTQTESMSNFLRF